jgi:hypothetical protein
MNSTELQEKINSLNNKKENLKTKGWFRALEVLFFLSATIMVGFIILMSFAFESFSVLFFGIIIIFILLKIIKKVGYYIILGSVSTVKPNYEETLEAKFKK